MPSWAIIENSGSILFLQRSEATSRSKQWFLPGGGIKKGETPEEACRREVKEESGLDIVTDRLAFEKNGVYYFTCRMVGIEAQNVVLKLNEAMDYRWVTPCNLLEIGLIMSLRQLYPILQSLGYTVELNEEAKDLLR